MSSWRECKLGDVAEVIGGGTPKTSISEYWNGNIPWLTPRDLTGYDKVYISHGERLITEEGLKNSSAKLMPKGTVLLTSRAPIGYVAIAENEICTNQGFKSLVPNFEILNSEFLYYWLKSNTDYLQQLGTGTTFAEISGSVVKDIDISLPSLEEQKRVAEVLTSLDGKIDLLHRQNRTLESIAQTLFRQWFIEEAKEEWEETSLYDAIKLIGGGTPKTTIAEYWDGAIGWLSGGDISSSHKGFVQKTEKTITQEGLDNSSTKLLPKYAMVISARGTVGKYCLLAEPMAFSQSNYGVLPKFDDCYFFTYLLISHSVDELQVAAYGSVFDTITTKTFQDQNVVSPDEEIIKKFENEITPYFIKIESNQKQIQTLENLRDTLLPKLLSGEVRVEI